ncbi:microsomal dipeptidase [Vibrio sp. JCM 19236]|nr:microsomal dipeptidase [Vibrio sp. JCM 19236]
MKLKTLSLFTALALSSTSFAHDIGHEHEHVEGGWNTKAGFVSDVDIEAELWNPRGKSQEEIIKRAIFLAEKYDLERTPEQQARASKAREKYSKAIAINSILPSSVGIIGNTEEIFTKAVNRNRDAGMTLVSATVYAFPGSTGELSAYQVVENSTKVVTEQEMIKVDTTLDILLAKKQGKMAVMFNTQGADYVAEDTAKHAKQSHESGIRTMNFTYNNNNALAGGGSKQDMGLTELGVQWVVDAQKNHLVVDVSHSSNQTAIEAAKVATKPILASHSNAQTLHNVSRNMSDEALKAVGETDGAVCPTGVGMFLNEELDAAPERYVEHVVYIADLIGKDKVCFSTDYVHNIQDYYIRDIGNTDVYPPELGFGSPISNIAAENIWDVVAILEDKHGWNEEEIKGFLGENLMRV